MAGHDGALGQLPAARIGEKTMTTELSGVQKHVDAARVLEVEQALLRIPSSAFQEQQIADHLAERMKDIGLEVTMKDVLPPFGPTFTSPPPTGHFLGSC